MKRLLLALVFLLTLTITVTAQATRNLVGSGSPEGVYSAPVGSMYRRTDGSANTVLYIKESGSGNTGWVAYGAAGAGAFPTTDANSIVEGSGDPTKELRIEVDGITASNTRVWTAPDSNTTIPIFSQVITFNGPSAARTVTLPDESFTVAGVTTTQTLQNKTLTNSNNVLGGVTLTLGSDATGDVYYRSAGGLFTRLGIGSTGQVLKVAGGLPSWADPLPVLDTASVVEDATDPSKEVRIEAGGITTGTIRVWTAPDSNTTIPIFSQPITFSGPTTARTVTLPDASFTVAGLEVAQTFSAAQTFSNNVLVPNNGLRIADSNASHRLIVVGGSDLSADRNFTITTGDVARTLSMGGNITTANDLITSGNFSLT